VDRTKLVVKGESWFALPHFEGTELQAVIDLLIEEHPETQIEKSDTTSRTIYKLKLNKDKLTINLYKSGNRKILVQGANSLLLQMVISFVSELVGIDKVEPILSSTYKVTIDTKKISDSFNDVCPGLPKDYPENIKRLVKQSIINLNYFIESEEYSMYTFPTLRALEGHIKYLFGKAGIIVPKTFEMFEFNHGTHCHKLKSTCSITDLRIKNKLEKYYNYFNVTRNTIFHFGDVIGKTDTTRMIETKEEADEIIKKCIGYICEE
jgi:ribonuclease HI